jgi:hypothetical protein
MVGRVAPESVALAATAPVILWYRDDATARQRPWAIASYTSTGSRDFVYT